MNKLLILLLIIHVSLFHGFGQIIEHHIEYPKYSPTALKQDLDFIFKKLGEVHPDFYKETPKDTVTKRLSLLKAQINKPMNRMDFMNLFAPVLFNTIKDGHNYLNGTDDEMDQYTKSGGLLFPFPVIMKQRRIFCNSEKAEIPYHAEILSINKTPARDVVEKILSTYNAESDDFEETLNAQWFSALYWSSYGGFQNYQIDYKPNGAALKTMVAKGRKQEEVDSLRTDNQTKNYSFEELPELKTGVIRYNACEDLEHFRPFCDSVFTLMKHKGYQHLIIDIRSNPGGTTRLNEMLYEYLTDKPITQFERIETKVSPEKKHDFIEANRKYAGWFKWYDYLYYPIYIRANAERKRLLTAKNGTTIVRNFKPEAPKKNVLLFTGKVHLLMGGHTYSAAAIFAAAFKAFKLGAIVGQETGEPTSFTGNSANIILPYTKLVCSISCERYFLIGTKNDGHGVIPDVHIDHDNTSDKNIDEELDYVKKTIALK
jgi:hypothetical protein